MVRTKSLAGAGCSWNNIRTPDTAKVKEKMLYASSKLVLRQSLPGFLTDVQGTELSEVLLDAGALLFFYSALSFRIDFVFFGSQ